MESKELIQAVREIIREELKPIKEKIDNLDGQQRENTDMIKALFHRSEELDAKFDGLLTTTAGKASVVNLDAKLDRIAADITFLVRKAAEHEDDIRNLKLIK